MRMRAAIALVLLAAASAAPAATPADRERARRDREARENPEFYNCGLVRTLSGGRLTIGVRVELDGRPSSYSFRWEGGAAGPGLSMTYSAGGTAYGPVGAWSADLSFATARRPGLAQLVLRDAAGRLLYQAPSAFSYGGRSPGSRLRHYRLEVPAQRFSEAIRTPGGLLVELEGRERLPAGRIDAAPLDAALAAIATARGEVEARVANYRRRCHPVRNEEIVVT